MPGILEHLKIFPRFGYGAFTLWRVPFQGTSPDVVKICNRVVSHHISPAFQQGIQFALSSFLSPLLTGSLLFSFPAVTKMFPFTAFLPHDGVIRIPLGLGLHAPHQ